LLSQIYLIIPTASLFTLFTQKNAINSSKIRKKSGKIGKKNCRKLGKVLEEESIVYCRLLEEKSVVDCRQDYWQLLEEGNIAN